MSEMHHSILKQTPQGRVAAQRKCPARQQLISEGNQELQPHGTGLAVPARQSLTPRCGSKCFSYG